MTAPTKGETMKTLRTSSALVFKHIIVLLLLFGVTAVPFSKADDKNPLFEKKGDKERIYNVPLDKLWSATMKAAAETSAVEYSNEKEGIITIDTGQSKASYGFRISMSLTKVDENKSRIKLTVKKLGV
jgi:hypothetical protein